MVNDFQLMQGDCLELMKTIPDGSVDMILCDLPYGLLNRGNPHAKWDCVLDLTALWSEYKRVTRETAAIVLFASGMFTANLMVSNPEMWRYNLVWKKGNRPTGFLNAKKQPMRIHEDICVFYRKQPTYNPQFSTGDKCHARGGAGNGTEKDGLNRCYGNFKSTPVIKTNKKYPLSVIDIAKEHPQTFHPTQKPVALLEYLIRTYTNPGDLVLDNCMGSGGTGVSCINTGRRFIGMELDKGYFDIACNRIADAKNSQSCEKSL